MDIEFHQIMMRLASFTDHWNHWITGKRFVDHSLPMPVLCRGAIKKTRKVSFTELLLHLRNKFYEINRLRSLENA